MVDVPLKTAPRLFLVDAYALIYRAFFAFAGRPLRNSRGENTSAAFGFANFLLSIKDRYAPDYLAVVFDKGMSHREQIYPAYKATRHEMPEELAASLPRIRQLLEAFRDPVVELEGYEADDVIGTLAVKGRNAGLEVVVVSGDKDLYQLVSPGVYLLNPGRGGPTGVEPEWVDVERVVTRFGVPPERVPDYLGLIGDASDNVPGAPGIGPKTAADLLKQFGTLEALLAHAEEIPAKRVRESLLNFASQVRLSKELVTVRTDLPLELDLEKLKVTEPDRDRLRELFAALEFRRLTERFTDSHRTGAPVQGNGGEGEAYEVVKDTKRVTRLVELARAAGAVAVDTETTHLDPTRADLVGIALAVEPGKAFYLPFGHRPAKGADGHGEEVRPVNLPPLNHPELRPLVALLEDPAVGKIGQNLKYDIIVLERAGVRMQGLAFDTMVASYVLDPGRREHNLEALVLTHLGHKMISYHEVVGKKGEGQIPFADVPVRRAADYACEDVDYTLRLKKLLEPRLQEQLLEDLYRNLELPLVPVLARMEANGIRIEPEVFSAMNRRLAGMLASLEEEIRKEAGQDLNLNSTPQLRALLFQKLGMPVIKKTKTGPSTDASVLEELAAMGYRLPVLILEYRQLEKLRNTYVDAIPKLVNPRTGRIHTSFNQTVTATGRLSSSDPNLQNIPVRTDLGREIRRGFVAEDGFLFLAADYSQIELRILAHLSGDPAIVEAFRRGIDVHRQTAALIFGVPLERVTSAMRARAKTINFATLYGQGEFSLARQLGIPREEARNFIQAYFQRFEGVRSFLDRQVALARERGYVETLSGRRRYIPELRSDNWNLRQFGERVAQNTPIQGSAADLIKRAMIRIHNALERHFPRARLLLQVHDELLLEVPAEQVGPVGAMVGGEMKGAMQLRVPLEVEIGVGKTWLDCKAE